LLLISRQTQKYHLSLAGEFFVAAELQRRGVSAAVTYGNAKSADVVAFSVSGEKAVVIEVKSTSQPTWVVGGFTPPPSPKPWVFVYLPVDQLEAPSYYVVLQWELHDILTPLDAEYRRGFKERHGVEYGDRRGVVNFTRVQAESFRNAWEKIIDQLLT
jgi:hypothetical protein